MTTIAKETNASLAQEKYTDTPAQEASQYTLWQILGIWLAGGAPIWVLGWLVYPALSQNLAAVDAGLLRMKLLTIGLAWQFVLSMIILYREEGVGAMAPSRAMSPSRFISTVRRRFWLNNPVSPKTGRKDNRLWWLLIPLILLTASFEFGVSPLLNDLWTRLFPFLGEPSGYSMAALVAPELRSRWIGAWNLLVLEVVLALFNTFLGEELLFRGVLLPKMKGVFGRWDWVANAVIFGLYHLHQPWGIPGDILTGLVFTLPGKRFRSNWFPILIHSAQSIYFIVLILGLVLGLAK